MSHETHKPSPETLELARLAVERNEAEKAKLAAMTPQEREAYIHAWSKGLAEQSVAIGERGVGCACCDPDVKAKIKQEESKVSETIKAPVKPVITLTCKCGAVLFKGAKYPSYNAITCPKCKLTSGIRRPEPVKPAKPPEQLASADASKQSPPYVANTADPMRFKA